MCVPEGCVAKAKAKGEEGLSVIIDILPLSRWIGIVEVGELPSRARKTHREPPCGIIVPEERFRDGLPSKLAGIPGFENGRHMLFGPRYGEGATVLDYQDNGLSSRNDGLEQLRLVVRQIQAASIEALARDTLTLAQAKNNDIGPFGLVHRGCDVFAVIEFDPRLWNFLAEAVQQTHMQAVSFLLIVAISSDVRIGTDYGNPGYRSRKW